MSNSTNPKIRRTKTIIPPRVVPLEQPRAPYETKKVPKPDNPVTQPLTPKNSFIYFL